MSRFTEQLKKTAAEVRLTAREKDAMHRALRAAMGAPEPSAPTLSPYFFFSTRFATPVAFILVLALGGGTAYAAQGALPGDALYPVKLALNERVESALAISDEAKADVEARFAARRAEEAETLAARGTLSEEVRTELEFAVVAHVEKARALAARLDTKKPGLAEALSARLSSSLAAHDRILAYVGEKSEHADSKENARVFAAHLSRTSADTEEHDVEVASVMAPESVPAPETMTVTMMAELVEDAKTGMEQVRAVPVVDDAPNAREAAALRVEERAELELEKARASFESVRHSLDESATGRIEERFTAAGNLLTAASSSRAAGDYGAALGSFKKVLDIAIRISAFIRAEERLDAEVLPLIENGNSSDEPKDARVREENQTLQLKNVR